MDATPTVSPEAAKAAVDLMEMLAGKVVLAMANGATYDEAIAAVTDLVRAELARRS